MNDRPQPRSVAKGGAAYGATDEFGRRAIDKPPTVYDMYATVLRPVGLDFKKLGCYHDGIERRLTDVHGQVIGEILALGTPNMVPYHISCGES